MKTKVGIDLLWVRPGEVGGTESYIRNLLKGFAKYADRDFEFYLFLSRDNSKSFSIYFDNDNFKKIECNVSSKKVWKRILWENFFLDRLAVKYRLNIMFIPVYSKPLFTRKKVKYVTVIHDLQALHFPEYFSFFRRKWLKIAWKNSIETSHRIVAISNFVRQDLIDKFSLDKDKSKRIVVIYNPITNIHYYEDFGVLSKKYNIEEKKYFYTISSMLPHKNTETLIRVVKKIKEKNLNLPKKLVISGINTKGKEKILKLIKKMGLMSEIILTGFISDSERNSLYKNALAFLFPSIFEGFGMPPVEAMFLGTPVITTKRASLYEVTKGKAIYVENPFDENEWIEKIFLVGLENRSYKTPNFQIKDYSIQYVTRRYLKLFSEFR